MGCWRQDCSSPRTVVEHCLRKNLQLSTFCHNRDYVGLLADEREVSGCWKILRIGRIALWRLWEQRVVPRCPLLTTRLECAFEMLHNYAVAAWQNSHGGPLGRYIVKPHPECKQVTTGCRVKIPLRDLPVDVTPVVPLLQYTQHNLSTYGQEGAQSVHTSP